MPLTPYVYTCSEGESFDSIALALYGSEGRAPELISANPEYSHALIFAGGEKLFIPQDTQAEDEQNEAPVTAPWRV